MESLRINLKDNPYDIYWESNPDQFKKLIQRFAGGQKNYIFTNEIVSGFYEKHIRDYFPASTVFVLPDGEGQKCLRTLEIYAEKLLSAGANRKSALWAFGGGVIGDLTGFLASIFMRGIPFFQIPTTLLSMVDSSVGGKTGVNLENGKNMIGTFYQPSGVFINSGFLETLDWRNYKGGMSEVVKSALLYDPELFSLIESRYDELNPSHIALNQEISRRSVIIKADVVSKDEKENDLRAILNLGHTLAHALESHYEYRGISHGEAVSVGTCFAGFLAVQLGILQETSWKRLTSLYSRLKMMHRWSELPSNRPETEKVIQLMKGDKKNTDSEIRFVFITDIGKFQLPVAVEIPKIKKCLEEFQCL